jgi:hypothetical protein
MPFLLVDTPRAIPGAVTVKIFRLGVSGNGRQPCDSPEAPDLLLDMMTNSAQYGRKSDKSSNGSVRMGAS